MIIYSFFTIHHTFQIKKKSNISNKEERDCGRQPTARNTKNTYLRQRDECYFLVFGRNLSAATFETGKSLKLRISHIFGCGKPSFNNVLKT